MRRAAGGQHDIVFCPAVAGHTHSRFTGNLAAHAQPRGHITGIGFALRIERQLVLAALLDRHTVEKAAVGKAGRRVRIVFDRNKIRVILVERLLRLICHNLQRRIADRRPAVKLIVRGKLVEFK